MVADIMTMLISSLSVFAVSSAIARAMSELRLLSWNSSKIRQATPSNPGSSIIIFVKMPSVTSSILVLGPILVSKRTL